MSLDPTKNHLFWKTHFKKNNKTQQHPTLTFVQLTANFVYWNKTNSKEIWRLEKNKIGLIP